jgi:hypothetical protein
MRKSIISCFASVAVIALFMAMTACTADEDVINPASGEIDVTFTATLDQYIDSRAVSDGSMVDKLIFIAYDESGNEIAGLRQDNVPVSGGHATINTRVVKGHRYTFAFWAQNSACEAYSFSQDYKSINVDYQGENEDGEPQMRANDETRDAFYAVFTGYADTPVTEPFEKNITLHRPFAQLNFGTTAEDIAAATRMAQPTGSRIKIADGVCSNLNLLNGEASSPVAIEMQAGAFLDESLVVDGEKYFYLSMNYLLVNNERSDVTGVTMTTVMNRSNQEFTHKLDIESLPVQRNFRTNVVGRLITKEVDFTIIIDNSFTAEESQYFGDEHWTKVDSVAAPQHVGNEYRITSPEQLAWFQDNAPDEGSTIVLRKSLDLDGAAIRPLLCGARNITIDGNDKAIRNFTLTADGAASLFGDAPGLTVKNFTVHKATITANPDGQGNAIAGAIVARANGTVTLNDVMVSRSTISGACMVGGLVGTVTAGSNIAATECHVANSTIENAEGDSPRGLAGGMVGYIASGATAEQQFNACEIYNTVVKARMSEDSLTSGKFIGALQGAADTDVVRINNCNVMAYFEALDEAAAAQQSPYGTDQLIGGNQQRNGHVYINNVEI